MNLFVTIFLKRFSQTLHLPSPFDLYFNFPFSRLLGVEATRMMDFRRCSLVKERRQSYSITLCDMTAVSSYLAFKESVSKVATS